jgi:hypothetical protein
VTFSRVTPGASLSPLQRKGVETISYFQGRDIVLAIDTTQSVKLSDEGILRLKQIVKDQLKNGDSIYIAPFASDIDLSKPPIEVKDQNEINQVISSLPLQSDPNSANTDIQNAELKVYKHLAQLNQDRLQEKQPVKFQAVVWITDAPLYTKTGDEWIETPATSPFRNPNSPDSLERAKWLQALPLQARSLNINDNYKLTVVDIPATVQEFCTPAPSGQETCLVDSYLISQLGMPVAVGLTTFLIVFGFISWKFWQTGGKIKLEITTTDMDEPQRFELKNNQKIAIGEFNQSYSGSIDCPGAEIRGYIQRQGRNFYIVPSGIELSSSTSMYYGENEIARQHKVSGSRINLNCPDHNGKEFLVEIVIDK